MDKKYILLIIVLIISLQLVIFSVSEGTVSRLFGNFRHVTVSFSRGWTLVREGVTGWRQYFFTNRETVEINRELLKEIGRLKNENALLYEKVRELSMKVEASLIEEMIPFEVVPANVIGRDPYDWLGKLVIDQGEREGMKAGLTVVTYEGMVGRVEEVFENYSEVRLILSTELATGAVIQRTRDIGVVAGKGEGLCSLQYIYRDSDVRVGDLVVTSGLGISTPRGIVVGKVVEVRDLEGSLFKEVVVEPACDFSSLEQTFIIRSVQ